MAEDPLHDLEIGTPSASPVLVGAAGGTLPKPAGKWLVQVKYDPDKDCRLEDFQTSAPDYAKRFGVLESVPEEDQRAKFAVTVPGQRSFIPVELEGQILEPISTEEVRRWKPMRVHSVKELKAFTESEPGKLKRRMESVGDSGFFGSDDPVPGQNAFSLIDREFVPILSGPFFKQLYLYDYLLMHARCLAGSTPIPLLDGTTPTIAELARGRHKNFWVYSCDAQGRVVPGLATGVKRTGRKQPL